LNNNDPFKKEESKINEEIKESSKIFSDSVDNTIVNDASTKVKTK